jgi:hypothetical protein
LKREFEGADEPGKAAALQRWQEAVDEFTDALLGLKPPCSERRNT